MKNKRKQHSWIQKGTAILVVLALILITFSSMSEKQALKAEGHDLDQGSYRITKTATPVDGMVNEWEVNLTVEVQNEYPPAPQDIMLVIDVSNSMSKTISPGETRLDRAKVAAKEFVNQILRSDYDNRMGIVTYSTYIEDVIEFTSYDDKEDLIELIDSLEPISGTHTQAGLHRASEEMISARDISTTSGEDVTRSIILLSDGMPTYSHKPEPMSNWGIPYRNGVQYMNLYDADRLPVRLYYDTSKSVDNFNYNANVGSGSSFRTQIGRAHV